MIRNNSIDSHYASEFEETKNNSLFAFLEFMLKNEHSLSITENGSYKLKSQNKI